MWMLYTAVATVLLVAGASKAADPSPLGALLQRVWRFRETPSRWTARGLGIAEIAIAFVLVTGEASRWAAVAATGASCVFLVAGIAMTRRAPGMACGCFGSLTTKLRTGRTQLALAAGLLAGSAALVGLGEPNARPALTFTVMSALSLGLLGTTAWRKIRSLPPGLLYPSKASA